MVICRCIHFILLHTTYHRSLFWILTYADKRFYCSQKRKFREEKDCFEILRIARNSKGSMEKQWHIFVQSLFRERRKENHCKAKAVVLARVVAKAAGNSTNSGGQSGGDESVVDSPIRVRGTHSGLSLPVVSESQSSPVVVPGDDPGLPLLWMILYLWM